MYNCNTVRWAWLDWGLSGWLTTLLQCFDPVGWVIRPVKISSQEWTELCPVGKLKKAFLTEWHRFFTLATTPSNQQNHCYIGPPSTETPTTETTTVQCHKNSLIYLTSTYYWWLLRPTYLIRFEIKKHYSHSTTSHSNANSFPSIALDCAWAQDHCDNWIIWTSSYDQNL